MADQYDRALIRLSSTEDEHLAPILSKLLPLVFDDLLTQTDATLRAKLVQLLNHVLTRSKGNSAIKLPALAIAERWFSPALANAASAPFFRNLSVIFLDLGVPRQTPQEQIDLALYALENFGLLHSGLDRVVIFLTSIAGLEQASTEAKRREQIPRYIASIKNRLAHDDGPVSFFQTAAEFLLIPCGAVEAPSVGGLTSSSWANWKSRLKSKSVAEMLAMKGAVLRWLAALATDPPAGLVYLPSLAASVDNYDAISTMAESNCKRLDPELDLSSDLALLGRLISAALTSEAPGSPSGLVKVEAKASVPTKFRHKVLSLLQRSKGSGKPELLPHVLHLLRQSLRDSEQVQMAALQLALVLAEYVSPEKLASTADMLFAEMEAVFWPGGGVVPIGTATPLAFRVAGTFARQLGELDPESGRKLALRSAPQMLAILASSDGAAQDVLEALGGLMTCLRGTGDGEREDFIPLLDRLVMSPRPVVRREVLRWAAAVFPATAPEGRYYALRLLGDHDQELVRAAEAALSGGREAPPFGDMSVFLASRALSIKDVGEAAAQALTRCLSLHAEVLKALAQKQAASLPPLTSGFSRRDLSRGLAFLLGLAEAEGLRQTEEFAMPPLPKRPRLAQGDEGLVPSLSNSQESTGAALLVLLDHLLPDILQGSAAAMEEAGHGMTILELVLRTLLLVASLVSRQTLGQALLRAEVVLLGGIEALDGAMFREGGPTAGRARRLGARVLGELVSQMESDCPAGKWLAGLGMLLAGPSPKGGIVSGAALTICELLRAGTASGPEARALCQQVLRVLLTAPDSDVLSACCEGLRRLSERQPTLWEALDKEGREALFDRLYHLSKPALAMGDKEAELGSSTRELAHSSWRLLGQLAAWGREGSADCIEQLISIGRQSPGEEASAALGLALAAAASDPTDPDGVTAAGREGALLQRLLAIAEAGQEETPGTPEGENTQQEAAVTSTAAERACEQRCGIVWLVVFLRRLSRKGQLSYHVAGVLERASRVLVRAIAGLSIFVADCALKGLCHLYVLAPPERRMELLKVTFASVSNRTMVSNMFVGAPDTPGHKEKDKGAPGANSLRITAKERVDLLKDLMFLARELHPPLFPAFLDQPASVWTGEIIREALDLQSPCLPDSMRSHLCPAALRPQLYPFLFHPKAPLRQTVIALTANYFNCESSQQLGARYPEDYPATARNLIVALGSSRVATREASIHAAQALFRGKTWREVEFLFEDFWSIVIKLMDDMESQIQAIVGPLVRMTRNLTLRLCDAKAGSAVDVEAAVKVTIPLLLQFSERHKHAQPLCFDLIKELVKASHGSPVLAPYVQDLIPPLLTSLSMMEHSSLQYYQFHIDAASEEKGRELEAARISNSRDSDSMKLLRLLVPHVTRENAEALAPQTRDALHRGVGANTRVGVCDFWVAVCAECPSAIPTSGVVATGMLRSVAAALLDPSREVRSAAASCFASLARRNSAQELTQVVMERLLKQEQEFRTDDAQRNAYRVSLARALSEVCRRCDSMVEQELRAAIAAKAFGLSWSGETEVKQGWEALWSELCPTTAGGVERFYPGISAELARAFADSVSRAEKVQMAKAVSALATQLDKVVPRPSWSQDSAVAELHTAVVQAVQSLPIFEGSGTIVRALADLAGLQYRRRRGEAGTAEETAIGLPLIRGFCLKGSVTDRASAVKALMEVCSATRLWSPLADAQKLYRSAASHVDQLQSGDEKGRELGQPPPRRHRGKGQSPAEELLAATLDLWATTLLQCRREVDDEGDLEPPDKDELGGFFAAALDEFQTGSLTLRLAIVRLWKHVLTHFAEERIAVRSHFTTLMCARLAASLQDAALDARTERLRRPALELMALMISQVAPGGGKQVILDGLAVAPADAISLPLGNTIPWGVWLGRIDPVTLEQCAEHVASLRL